MVIKLNDKSLLTDVGRDALELKGLKNGPIEKFLMSRGKFPQVLDHALVVLSTNWLQLGSRDLRRGMLAGRFV